MTAPRLIALLAPRPAARDGRGASEPPRPCRLPSGAGGEPEMSLADARATIRRARVSETDLRAACTVLRLQGDWIDVQRADLLEALLADPATAPAEVTLATAARRVEWGDVLGALAVFALLIAGLWVAFGAGWPTGGAELMEAVR